MTTHAVATLTVTNPESLAAYREKAGAALAKHGGAILQASGDLAIIEGEGTLPTAIALLSFPSKDAAQAWMNDPALSDVHALRRGSGTTTITLL